MLFSTIYIHTRALFKIKKKVKKKKKLKLKLNIKNLFSNVVLIILFVFFENTCG